MEYKDNIQSWNIKYGPSSWAKEGLIPKLSGSSAFDPPCVNYTCESWSSIFQLYPQKRRGLYYGTNNKK